MIVILRVELCVRLCVILGVRDGVSEAVWLVVGPQAVFWADIRMPGYDASDVQLPPKSELAQKLPGIPKPLAGT